MQSEIFLKTIGMVFVVIGLVLVSNPELITNNPIPSDTFEAVERRVWWGLFISAGMLPFFHHQLKPWLPTIVAIGVAFFSGLLLARVVGIFLDGSVIKQWVYVGIEVAILVPLTWRYLKIRQ